MANYGKTVSCLGRIPRHVYRTGGRTIIRQSSSFWLLFLLAATMLMQCINGAFARFEWISFAAAISIFYPLDPMHDTIESRSIVFSVGGSRLIHDVLCKLTIILRKSRSRPRSNSKWTCSTFMLQSSPHLTSYPCLIMSSPFLDLQSKPFLQTQILGSGGACTSRLMVNITPMMSISHHPIGASCLNVSPVISKRGTLSPGFCPVYAFTRCHLACPYGDPLILAFPWPNI